MFTIVKGLGLSAAILFLSACGGGGSLSLEPGARKIATKGSPYVTVNQGGRSLIVEQGKTKTTGTYGWVAVQAISARHVASPDGNKAVLNKTDAFTQ